MIPAVSRIKDFYDAQEGKAFPYRVELTDAGGPLYSGSAPASFNDYNGFSAPRTTTPLSQREAPIHMQTYGGNQSIDWLIDAVNFTVQSASAADYHFADGPKDLVTATQPTDPPGTTVAPQDLIDLFNEPNPFMGWADLCELTLIDWLIVGNGYWVKWQMDSNGKPLALYRMAPEFVKIVPGQFGPATYNYRLPGAQQDTVFQPDQVVHFKRPNPHNPFYGLGLVKGGARPLDMEIALTDTMASYYEKQALPSGVVQTDRRVPRDVFNKLKQQLRTFYGGGRNAGQLMVLEAGLKYDTVSPTAADALFATMGGFSRDRILAMFNLHKKLLGMTDGDAVGVGEIAQWQLLFDQKTMMPLCKKFSESISRGLTQPAWNLDFSIDYEETQQPDQVMKRAQTISALPGVKVREVRQAANLPPTGDPDIDDFVLNLPSPNLDANGQGGAADRNLAGEAGRPPIGNNVRGFGQALPKGAAPPAAKPATGGAVAKPGKKALDSDGNEYEIIEGADFVPGMGNVYGGYRPKPSARTPTIAESLAALDRLESIKALKPANVSVGEIASVRPPEDLLAKDRMSGIDGLSAAMQSELEAAAHTLERGLLDATEGKAEGTAYQRVKNSAAWATFKAKLDAILTKYTTQALSLANVQHSDQGLTPSDSSYGDTAESIVTRPAGLDGILNTLKSSILNKVLGAQRKSADKSEMDTLIRQSLDDWKAKAGVIALTEASHAYNIGTLDIAESNGSTEVLVSDGDDTDAPCVAANGSTWTIDQARENTLEHPNCRRAFVPLS
jgi:HK97 family phage portal protein